MTTVCHVVNVAGRGGAGGLCPVLGVFLDVLLISLQFPHLENGSVWKGVGDGILA